MRQVTMRPRLTTSCFVGDCANTFEMLRSFQGEECLTQHRLLVCIFKIAAVPRVKRKFTPQSRTWKLRDPACAAEFEAKFEQKCSSGQVVDSTTQSSDEIWDHLKSTLNSAAEEVCGYSKNDQWKRETRWWDMKVDEAVKEKRSFKVWSRLKKQRVYGDARKATRAAYETAK